MKRAKLVGKLSNATSTFSLQFAGLMAKRHIRRVEYILFYQKLLSFTQIAPEVILRHPWVLICTALCNRALVMFSWRLVYVRSHLNLLTLVHRTYLIMSFTDRICFSADLAAAPSSKFELFVHGCLTGKVWIVSFFNSIVPGSCLC